MAYGHRPWLTQERSNPPPFSHSIKWILKPRQRRLLDRVDQIMIIHANDNNFNYMNTASLTNLIAQNK